MEKVVAIIVTTLITLATGAFAFAAFLIAEAARRDR